MFWVLVFIYSLQSGDISSFTDPRIFHGVTECVDAARIRAVEMQHDGKYKKANYVCYGRNFFEDYR